MSVSCQACNTSWPLDRFSTWSRPFSPLWNISRSISYILPSTRNAPNSELPWSIPSYWSLSRKNTLPRRSSSWTWRRSASCRSNVCPTTRSISKKCLHLLLKKIACSGRWRRWRSKFKNKIVSTTNKLSKLKNNPCYPYYNKATLIRKSWSPAARFTPFSPSRWSKDKSRALWRCIFATIV